MSISFYKKYFSIRFLVSSLLLMSLFISCLRNTSNFKDKIEIEWIGHSCFEIRFREYRILIDPFSPERFEKTLPQKKYDIVFATHKAEDHYYFEGVDADTYLLARGDKNEFISEKQTEERNIKGKTIQETADSSFSYWTVASFHDDQQGAAEGVNGIICLDFNGIKVVHLGNLGHVIEGSRLEQIGPVDILMIPVDGYFTIDIDTAKIIIRQLNPRIVLPMHYKTEQLKATGSIYTEEDILAGFKNAKKLDRSHLAVNRGTLSGEQKVFILDFLHRDCFPPLKGPYLGQKPPGKTPILFAPDVFPGEVTHSSSRTPFNVVFSPDGCELYFVVDTDDNGAADILWMKRVNDIWTRPVTAPFNSRFNDLNMCFSPDGFRFFFRSKRPLPGSDKPSKDRHFMWYMVRTKNDWSTPRLVEYEGFETKTAAYQSVAFDGTLYFATDGKYGDLDLHCSRFVNGSYAAPKNLGGTINTQYSEGDMFIMPDKSFLIVSCWRRPDNNGESDLYISFPKQDGSWTKLQNMGEKINSVYSENCPQVSSDGKYFFFTRYDPAAGRSETYWVDASIIQELKPKELN